MYKGKYFRYFVLILILIFVFINVFLYSNFEELNSKAQSTDSIVDSITISRYDNSDAPINDWDYVKVNISWSEKDVSILSGDYLIIDLPSELIVKEGVTFNIKDNNNVTAGAATISQGVLTVSFNDYVNGKSNVTGTIWIDAKLNLSSNIGTNDVDFVFSINNSINITVTKAITWPPNSGYFYQKWGEWTDNTFTKIDWYIAANISQSYSILQNLNVVDELQSGHKYVDGSIMVIQFDGIDANYNVTGNAVDITSKMTISIIDNIIDVSYRYFDKPILIVYQTQITDDTQLSFGSNTTITSADATPIRYQCSLLNIFYGGTANGVTIPSIEAFVGKQADNLSDELIMDLSDEEFIFANTLTLKSDTSGYKNITITDQLESILTIEDVYVLDENDNNITSQGTIFIDNNNKVVSFSLNNKFNYGLYASKSITLFIKSKIENDADLTSYTNYTIPNKVSMNFNGNTITSNQVTVTSKGKILIKVIDNQTNNPLSGAVFWISDSQNNVLDRLTTDTDGFATLSGVYFGNYSIEEKKPPSNYDLPQNTINSITINNITNIVTVTVPHKIATTEPSTETTNQPTQENTTQVTTTQVTTQENTNIETTSTTTSSNTNSNNDPSTQPTTTKESDLTNPIIPSTTENQITEPTTKSTENPKTEQTIKPTENSKTEPTTKPTENPKTEPTTKSTESKKTEPTTKPTKKQKTEPTTKPTKKQKTEPTTKPTKNQKTEPTTKPTKNQKTEPNTKPKIEPTIEPKTEPSLILTTESPTQEPNNTITSIEPSISPNLEITDIEITTEIKTESSSKDKIIILEKYIKKITKHYPQQTKPEEKQKEPTVKNPELLKYIILISGIIIPSTIAETIAKQKIFKCNKYIRQYRTKYPTIKPKHILSAILILIYTIFMIIFVL